MVYPLSLANPLKAGSRRPNHLACPWPDTRSRTALPGVPEAVRALAAQGVPLAVASVISAVLEQLRLTEYFRIVQSAEFEPYGKPHPGVYLTTARRLGVAPEECVAIEDSVTGVAAAKAARMACLAVPAPAARDDCRFSIADDILPSLADLDTDMLRRFGALHSLP